MPLKERWKQFNVKNPKVRIRDAAIEMKTSEEALVSTACGKNNLRLKPEFQSILNQLEKLGSVMALTRSDHAVHEAHGIYKDMKYHGSVAMFFIPGIDTRFFLDKWSSVYAVNENDRHSLQFFDYQGDAVHKIYVTDKTNKTEYFNLIKTHQSDNQAPSPGANHALNPKNDYTIPEEPEISSDELQKHWLNIRDVHEASRIIKRYGIHRREKIYKALGEVYAIPLSVESVEQLLVRASTDDIPLMIFAMNHATVQNYAGPVKKLLRTGPWFNVLDPDFNLHLRTEGIGQVWLIKKPSDDGWVTTINVLDNDGFEFLLIADHRVRGEAESSQWQDLCRDLV